MQASPKQELVVCLRPHTWWTEVLGGVLLPCRSDFSVAFIPGGVQCPSARPEMRLALEAMGGDESPGKRRRAARASSGPRGHHYSNSRDR